MLRQQLLPVLSQQMLPMLLEQAVPVLPKRKLPVLHQQMTGQMKMTGWMNRACLTILNRSSRRLRSLGRQRRIRRRRR